jgi:hypothetical protein
MHRINREELLTKIRHLRPGLSPADSGIEQSDAVVFEDGRLVTFNDEVACSVRADLPIRGAVTAGPLLALLEKMNEEEIEIEAGESELLVVGKRRRAGIYMEAEVTLPVHTVERPEKADWKNTPEELYEAIRLVEGCAGRNELEFNLTCVHIHPEWVEACDNARLARYRMETGVSEPILVKRDAIRCVAELGAARMAETPSWIHFRGNGVTMSLRRFIVEDYPDMSALLDVDGEVLGLPKGLKEAAARADEFARHNAEVTDVVIDLRPEVLVCRAKGSLGWYEESRRVSKYSGQRLQFAISPAVISEIVQRHSECVVSRDRIKVNGGKWEFAACLGIVETEGRS